jgi:cytochrome P450
MIEEGQKNQSAGANDLFAMMLEANRGEPDTAGLVDNLSTFLGAGTETTAVALCWAWYLLAKHPAAHRKLRQEVEFGPRFKSPDLR